MIDYLSNLVARQLGKSESVHPRLASRFEPPAAIRPPDEQMSFEDAEAPDESETGDAFGLETLELTEPVSDVQQSHQLSSPRRTTKYTQPERDDLPPTLPEISTRNQDRTMRAKPLVEQPPAETKAVVEPVRVQTVSPSLTENLSPPEPVLEATRPLSTPRQSPAPGDAKGNSDKALDAPLHVHSEREDERQSIQDNSLMPIQSAPRILSEQNVLPPPPPGRRDDVRITPAAEPREDKQSAPQRKPPPPTGLSRYADSPPQSSDAPHPSLRANQAETTVEPPTRSPEVASNVIAQPHVTRSTETKAHAQAASSEAVEAAPVINVTISRVEVRATPAPAAPRRQSVSTPLMSLDDYLRRRSGGGRR